MCSVINLADLCLLLTFSFSSPSGMLMLGMLGLSLSQRSLRFYYFFSVCFLSIIPSSSSLSFFCHIHSAIGHLQLVLYFRYCAYHFCNFHLILFVYCYFSAKIFCFFQLFSMILVITCWCICMMTA